MCLIKKMCPIKNVFSILLSIRVFFFYHSLLYWEDSVDAHATHDAFCKTALSHQLKSASRRHVVCIYVAVPYNLFKKEHYTTGPA